MTSLENSTSHSICADKAIHVMPVEDECQSHDAENATRTMHSSKISRKGRVKAIIVFDDSHNVRVPLRDNFTGDASFAMHENSSKPMHSNEAINQIVDLAKTRKQWQLSRMKLYLQALSICRGACDGDKVEAVKLYKLTASGDDWRLLNLIGPMIEDLERWDARIAPIEKEMSKLIAKTPIGEYVTNTKGLGALSIATLIGHSGPFTAYSKISKLWRRFGLDVSEDGKSRGPLIIPGIADYRQRRAAAYVIGTGLIKAKNETFRGLYDRYKEAALAKEWTKARAHNHAMRVATKYFIRQMRNEWIKNEIQE